METVWLEILKALVQKKPLVILRFSDDEWESLTESKNGPSEFTVARKHTLLNNVKVPIPCIVIGKSNREEHLYFGLISSKAPVTTLQTRIKIKRAVRIHPQTEDGLNKIVTEKPFVNNLRRRLHGRDSVISLSPLLSGHLIDKLASIEENRGAMRAVAESLSAPKYFRGNDALQEDAIQTALSAFGLDSKDKVLSLDLVAGQDTALARVNINEDSVVEHDARHVPGFDLVESDLTGHAKFEKGGELLEVFTANRRPLEHCFGVDLIYLNMSKQNIVMLQYKMLEPQKKDFVNTDWVYRPDGQLDKEIQRMKLFSIDHLPKKHEYRLNSTVFYLKFVKRDGSISGGSIITPLDHFEILRNDPICVGPNGALRLSYMSLSGRYLRQNAFLELIHSG